MSEYSIFNSSDWTAGTTKPYSGSYAAENISNGSGVYNNSITLERGDTIEMHTYLGEKNGETTGIEFWAFTNSDATKCYIYYVSASENRHWLGYYDNGTKEAVESESSITIPSDEWLRVEMKTNSSTIEGNLYDSSGNLISTLSGTDTRLSSGGYGFQDEWAAEDAGIYVDNIRVQKASSSALNVIEDFSDGSVSDYATVGESNWTTSTDVVYNGSYSAYSGSNGDAIYDNTYTYERDGPIEVRTYLGTSNGASTGLEFWLCTNGDASQKYVHSVSAEENEHFLMYQPRWGEREVIDYAYSVDIPSDEWLRMEVYADSSSLESHVYDSAGNRISTLNGSDSNLASGGYGFKDQWRGESPPVYVDHVRGP